jgi:hypothetical protein
MEVAEFHAGLGSHVLVPQREGMNCGANDVADK